MNIKDKTLQFYTALADCYKDEEDRNLQAFTKLNLADGASAVEDFTAMVAALYVFYNKWIDDGSSMDFIGFTHFLNRLVIQYVMETEDENETD